MFFLEVYCSLSGCIKISIGLNVHPQYEKNGQGLALKTLVGTKTDCFSINYSVQFPMIHCWIINKFYNHHPKRI